MDSRPIPLLLVLLLLPLGQCPDVSAEVGTSGGVMERPPCSPTNSGLCIKLVVRARAALRMLEEKRSWIMAVLHSRLRGARARGTGQPIRTRVGSLCVHVHTQGGLVTGAHPAS